MRQQDDLKAVAALTKGIATATTDQGALRPDYKLDVAATEMASSAQVMAHHGYAQAAEACLKSKADMARMCASMLQEVGAVEKATKEAVAKINDAGGKVSQSLQRTKDMMGPQVEERLRQLERLVDCMERLRALEADGTAGRVFNAIKR